MNPLMRVIVNGISLWVASVIVPGITLGIDGATSTSKILTVLLVGALFGVVNAIVRPLAKLIGLPLLFLSLGLFIFVINAGMLMLTSWLAGGLGLTFHVDRFWPTAVLGALIVSAVSWFLGAVFGDDDADERRRYQRMQVNRQRASYGSFGSNQSASGRGFERAYDIDLGPEGQVGPGTRQQRPGPRLDER